VVPELASREHLRAIVPVVRAALAQAGITLNDLDAIAVTAGPGLAGALLVGITYAKALAFGQGLPLVAVNHLEGHIHAVLLHELEAEPRVLRLATLAQDDTPNGDEASLALVVSGGHTHLYLARPEQGAWSYRLVGRTLDDAAGEAYDKVAKLLGFGYPGGPWIDALARFGNPLAVPFAFSQIKHKAHLGDKPPRTKGARTSPIAELDPRFLFSFSGIKTAVLRYVELHEMRGEAQARAAKLFPPQFCHSERAPRVEGPAFPPHSPSGAPTPDSESWETTNLPAHPLQTKEEALALAPQPVLDLLASFQHAVVGDLMKKSFAAAESLGARRILVTGGVAANRELRARFSAEAARRGIRVAFPTLALSTDNAAMIAAAAWPRFVAGEFADSSLSGDPSLALGR
jgi:N6-L-threonylcarbamoyladenine synthase